MSDANNPTGPWAKQFFRSLGEGVFSTRSKSFLQTVGTVLLVVALTLLSLYGIWGWLTIQDIRSYCAKNDIDPEVVLYGLAAIPNRNETVVATRDPNGTVTIETKNEPVSSPLDLLPVKRFDVTVRSEKINMKKQTLETHSYEYLLPFLTMSENVNHVFCCFGVGYMTGLLIVGVESLKPKKPTKSRLVLRPLVGSLAGCILLIVILSGGSVIWNEVAGMNGLSLGMIAVIGCVFCEKMKTMLTTTV